MKYILRVLPYPYQFSIHNRHFSSMLYNCYSWYSVIRETSKLSDICTLLFFVINFITHVILFSKSSINLRNQMTEHHSSFTQSDFQVSLMFASLLQYLWRLRHQDWTVPLHLPDESQARLYWRPQMLGYHLVPHLLQAGIGRVALGRTIALRTGPQPRDSLSLTLSSGCRCGQVSAPN